MPKENQDLNWQCLVKNMQSFRKGSSFPIQHWNSICFTYMQGGLTRITDRVIAFSGIAKEIQELIKDDYFAGLWGHTFLRGLCWSVRDCQQANGELSFRPQKYRAPSWSFLSVEGAVESFCGGPPECELIDILDVRITVTGQDQVAGPMERGYLQARGLVQPITWKHAPEPDTTLKWMIDDTVVHTGIRVKLDESPSIGGLSPDLFCVPVARYDYFDGARKFWFGLVLETTGMQDAEFRRRGVFDIWDDDLYARMFERDMVRAKEEQTEPDGNDHSDGCDGVQKTEFTII